MSALCYHDNSANAASLKRAQKKRMDLLSLLPDQFTPTQAGVAWNLDVTKTNAVIQKMRLYKLITANEGKNRIFTKAKESL